MTDTTGTGHAFSIGASLKRAFSTFLANFISFNLLGLVVMLPGTLVVGLVIGAVFAGTFVAAQGVGRGLPDFGFLHFAAFGFAWIALLTLQYFLTAVIVYGALRYLQGERAGFGACLGQGLRRLGPIIVVAVISTFLTMIGFLFFIVPGIIIILMICVAIPVLMVEKPGSLASLKRSRELTKGYRWHLFGLFLLAFVAAVLAVMVATLPFEILAAFIPAGGAFEIAGAVVQFAMQLFTTVFFAVLLAVAYHDLRVAKEGVSSEQIAAVFD